jgi:hypothetical protein
MDESHKLLLCLFIPLLVTYLIVAIIQKSFLITLKFDTRGFYKQPIFLLIAISSFLFFLVFSYIAWSGHIVSLNSNGLNNFLKIGILPIGILSGTIVLLNLISRAHTSHQTEIQISESKRNSKLDNFKNHKSEFVDFINNYIDPDIVSKNNKLWISPSTHHILYELSKSEGLDENPKIIFKKQQYESITAHLNLAFKSFRFLTSLSEEIKTAGEGREILDNLYEITIQLKQIRSYIANDEIFEFLSKPLSWYSIEKRTETDEFQSKVRVQLPKYTIKELRELFRIIHGYLVAISRFENKESINIGVNNNFDYDIFHASQDSYITAEKVIDNFLSKILE